MDGKGTIPAASTGAQRKNLISTAPIPIDPVRKVPRENAQAGPSESRLDPRFIAGSRRKLNLNEPQESEVQWVTQGDPGESPYFIAAPANQFSFWYWQKHVASEI